MSTIKIGLFGSGVVGEGIYQVLEQKASLGAEIKKVVIKQKDKARNAPSHLFSLNANDILEDDEIDLVVELIDDSAAAYDIAEKALKSGKSVVSANKKMIAEKHKELIALSRENGVSFLYEAAVCGSIPIIRNLEEYFDNDLLHSVKGIVNGSTNYILSRMLKEGESFDVALKSAKESGFAESDPYLDVEGVDAAYKLGIIALHAFGKRVELKDIIRKGITSLHPFDFQYAKEKRSSIKLIAKSVGNDNNELQALSVLPSFVPISEPLAQTNNEFNGVIVKSSLADEQFFYGKGAGRFPTSSAVLSDISAFKYDYRYEYKKGIEDFIPQNNTTASFYISFNGDKDVNKDLFERIEESFTGRERSYLLGEIKLSKLLASEVLQDPEISVIQLQKD